MTIIHLNFETKKEWGHNLNPDRGQDYPDNKKNKGRREYVVWRYAPFHVYFFLYRKRPNGC